MTAEHYIERVNALEGKSPFSEETQQRIGDLRQVYGLDLKAEDSHRLNED